MNRVIGIIYRLASGVLLYQHVIPHQAYPEHYLHEWEPLAPSCIYEIFFSTKIGPFQSGFLSAETSSRPASLKSSRYPARVGK